MFRFIPYLSVLFSFLIYTKGVSQTREVDSLKKILKRANTDSLKCSAYHDLYFISGNLDYAKKNLQFARKRKYWKGISLALRDFGHHYYFSEKKDISLNYFSRAAVLSLKYNDSLSLMSSYRYMGYIYMINDPATAKEYYLKSLKIARRFNRKIAESYALSALGNVYESYIRKKEYIKIALDYYLKSLEIREKLGDQIEIASSLNEISRIYHHLGEFEKATELRFRALKIAEKINNIENLVYINISIGEDYLKRIKDYKKALSYELKAYRYCLKQKDNIEKMYDITRAIAVCYSKLNCYVESNKYYGMSIAYNDSITERVKLYEYNISVIKHGLEKELAAHKLLLKDTEILKQKAETARQTSLRNSILIGTVVLFFLAIFIFKIYRINHKNNRKLKQLLLDKELLFKEVHHRVKNNLQIISSLLNLQSNTISDAITLEALKQSQSRINTMAILHNKLYQTQDFTNISLDEYLSQLVTSISDSFSSKDFKVDFDFRVDKSIMFNLDTAIPFGLILNELITNSFKYAFINQEVGLISINILKTNRNEIHFTFNDNGVGLPDDYKERAQNSLGLELIEMLTQQLNGTLTITNNNGARFEIKFAI